MIIKWFKHRLSEPSTWAGIATLAGVLGFPELAPLIGKIGLVATSMLSGALIAHKEAG